MTLPAAGAPLDKLRFGFVSCANYEHGYFSAYRHLADENPDLVLFLGDYIYEYVEQSPTDRAPPQRRRRSDDAADLSQPLCAVPARSRPAAAARDGAGARHLGRPRGAERLRRQVVAMLRRSRACSCSGAPPPIRRSTSTCRCGRSCRSRTARRCASTTASPSATSLEISLLDGRQYRSRDACYGRPNRAAAISRPTPAARSGATPAAPCSASRRKLALRRRSRSSPAHWNVIAQDVLMAQLRQKHRTTATFGYWTDDWDGYPAARTPAALAHRADAACPIRW